MCDCVARIPFQSLCEDSHFQEMDSVQQRCLQVFPIPRLLFEEALHRMLDSSLILDDISGKLGVQLSKRVF
jgi:hypothetical protein